MAESSWLSAAFYAYFAVGSVALGYLLLRLTYPDIRLFELRMKLGISAVSGFLLVLAAFLVDYLFDGAGVLARQGFFPIVLFLLLAASFLVLKLYFLLSQSSFLLVGIPMASPRIAVLPRQTLGIPAPAPARVASPPPASPHAAPPTPETPLPAAPPSFVPPWVQRSAEKPKAAEETKTQDKMEPLHLDLSRVLRPSGKPGAEPPKPATSPFQKLKDAFAPEKAKPLEKPQKTTPALPSEPTTPPAATAFQKPRPETSPAVVPPKPKPSSQEAPKAIYAAPTPSTPEAAVRPPPTPPTPTGQIAPAIPLKAEDKERQKKQVILKLKKEEAYAEPKPGFLSSLFSWLSPKPHVKKIEKPKSLLQPPPEPLRLRPGARPVPKPQEKPPAQPLPEEPKGYLAAITKVVEESRQEKEEVSYAPMQEGEEIATPEVLVIKPSKEERPRPLSAKGQLKDITEPSESEASEADARPELKEKESPKSAEAQAPQETPVIMTYRGPRKIAELSATPQPSPEEDEFVTDVLKPSDLQKPEQKPDMVKRRYLMSAEGRQQDVSVIAPKQATEKENFDVLVQDVYSELKSAQREEGLQNKLSFNAPPKEATASAISVSDLLDSKKAVEPTAPPSSALFQQLREMSEKKESSIEFVKMQAEKEMGCPTCHAKNARIIFCPYCGTGLCANCSPKVKPFADKFVYACPKCKEDIEVKRKAA